MIFDFRIRVFHEVASRLSFTKAAAELNITQPAVTKHIREMENQLGIRLFNRQGSHITLTMAGEVVFRYTEKILNSYRGMEAELSQVMDIKSGILRIGASTTVAQTILPRLLAIFRKAYPQIEFTFIQGNSDFITQQVIAEALDIAIVEGVSHHAQVSYTPFMKDELVLVTNSSNGLARRDTITIDELYQLSLVMREAGSGTLDVIKLAMQAAEVDIHKLRIDIKLESTIAIKQYLMYSDSAAFLSIQSIVDELKYRQLSIIDIEGLEIYREFQFIHLQGNHMKLVELFKRFCLSNYNQR
jgi:DNA-binding transcriptional LysR family regulator